MRNSRANSGCNGEKSSAIEMKIWIKRKLGVAPVINGSGSIDNWSCKCKTMKEKGFISCCD